jgi:SAM-dependent methyltransferase
MGLEVSEGVAEQARALGLDVRAADVTSLKGESFDVVRFSHVLEHLRDPYETLVQSHALLGPGGYLMIAVPRMPSALTALLGRRAHFHLPFHLYHFSPRGMRMLLERSGFRIVSIKSKSNSMLCQGVSRWLHREELVNQPWMRALCIGFEMLLDAASAGGSMEIHAKAV